MIKFIYFQSKAFYNQSLINNLINDLEGKHIIFIQPDLKSFKSSDKKLNYINNFIQIKSLKIIA